MSYVILGLIFYGLFTLVALIFRLLGRDPLRRAFEPDTASYWVEHKRRDARSYFKQF